MHIPVVVGALALTALLLGHGLIPSGIGTWVDALLPWSGLALIPLAVLALVLKSGRGAISLLVPLVVLALLFGRDLVPLPSGPVDLRVATQNLDADNPAQCKALQALSEADLLAAQEVTAQCGLDYPHHFAVGTVALWSRYPITDSARLDLDLGWYRALRATVNAPHGPVTVFVAHLGSVRPGATEDRDRSLRRLAELARAQSGPVLVLGDLNTASTDREMALFQGFQDARSGFGFTWPAAFPVVRLDHVLYRGLTPGSATTSAANGSDHRAAVAGFTTSGQLAPRAGTAPVTR